MPKTIKHTLPLLFLLLPFLKINSALAADNPPYPQPYVECSQKEIDEWHSLRPYQASPCEIPINVDEQAVVCGNDLIVNDRIIISGEGVNGSENYYQDDHRCLDCWPPPGGCNGTVDRHFNAYGRDFIITFDAYKSELPIAGNTELVKGDVPFPVPSVLKQSWRLTGGGASFSNHLPPELSNYNFDKDYYAAYQEWRGKYCIKTPTHIPIINIELPSIMLCSDILGSVRNPNYWANLFPNIPFSSTEDRVGKARVYDMIWYPDKSSIDYPDPNPPDTTWTPHDPAYGSDPNIIQNGSEGGQEYGETAMYFPHMEENVELSTLMQSTYLPKELLQQQQSDSGVEPSPQPNPDCKIVNIRHNPGDQLFGERMNNNQGDGVPNAHVKYDAHFQCPVTYKLDPWGNCHYAWSCTRNAWFQSDVETFTPLIDELFTKTVAGNASIVKKVFPQLGPDTPLEKIEDIPASTSVTHTTRPANDHTHPEIRSMPAEFYIPHFGSIYDYLLLGTQTALRPKGFPGKPAGLVDNQTIPEVSLVNEYLSWYFNGTLYRSEQNPLDVESNCIGETTQKAGVCRPAPGGVCMTFPSIIPPIPSVIDPFKESDGQSICAGFQQQCCVSRFGGEKVEMLDMDRVVNLSGPLNKLLSQHSQWRNIIPTPTPMFGDIARVFQAKPRAERNRHNQIVGCTIGFNIPILNIEIGGIPVACESQSQKNVPGDTPPGASPQPGECKYPSDPSASDPVICHMSSTSINGITLPSNMKRVFEAAGTKWNVPPDLIAGLMMAEGGFEPRVVASSCYGEYNEDNIDHAIRCKFDHCDPADWNPPCNYNASQGPYSCPGGGTHFGPYQQCMRNDLNPCNFYDATMIAAEDLYRGRYGISSETGSCLGYNYNTGSIQGSVSCEKSAWTCEDVITAIHRWEGMPGVCNPSGHTCNALRVYGACNSQCP